MTVYPERQVARAAGWSRRTGAFSAVLLLTAWIGHHYGLVETGGFLWVLALVALLALLALLFSGFALARLWNHGAIGGRDVSVGALLAVLVLVPYGVVGYGIAAYPALRDISTDLDNPPRFEGSSRTTGMNVLAPLTPGEERLQAQIYPLVTGHRYDLPLDETLAAVHTVLDRRGWTVVGDTAEPQEGQNETTITVLATSFVLELPVDVAIRVTTDGETTLVDMRSASRYGRHDLGDNAERIIAFLAELDQEVSAQIGTTAAQ
ncbi:DUF1499 domain-containing protein [Mesorhizobium sp. 1M-11]|uniref:DUF1499 domain-containing protein n=1 Tax=Mesorhizobium sp. 1M-11 TaxID=1529006 RepID=UPI0006C76E58|nr:DUF1499 domain-containing protein [Mesorhizobium sp. 1M-11]